MRYKIALCQKTFDLVLMTPRPPCSTHGTSHMARQRSHPGRRLSRISVRATRGAARPGLLGVGVPRARSLSSRRIARACLEQRGARISGLPTTKAPVLGAAGTTSGSPFPTRTIVDPHVSGRLCGAGRPTTVSSGRLSPARQRLVAHRLGAAPMWWPRKKGSPPDEGVPPQWRQYGGGISPRCAKPFGPRMLSVRGIVCGGKSK